MVLAVEREIQRMEMRMRMLRERLMTRLMERLTLMRSRKGTWYEYGGLLRMHGTQGQWIK